MRRIAFLFTIIAVGLIAVSVFFAKISFNDLASLFFTADFSPQILASKYADSNLKILIVPGHDNEYYGTSFEDIKEADLTLKIGSYLFDYLRQNKKFKVFIVMDENGYLPEFREYFKKEDENIQSFISEAVNFFHRLAGSGTIKKTEPPIEHVNANKITRKRLYGINKWANENDIDIVLHLHLNDYPGRQELGKYAGFSLYIPEKQMPNYSISYPLAEALLTQFSQHWPRSNFPKEKNILIEDQDLIALGSYGTLKSASIVIEYGYITEPRFRFEPFLKEAALETSIALNKYFEKNDNLLSEEFTWIKPYRFSLFASYGDLNNINVAMMQAVLNKKGFYPPNGKTLHECPLSGNFKSCTLKALKNFQKDNNIEPSFGDFLGPKTIEALNSIVF